PTRHFATRRELTSLHHRQTERLEVVRGDRVGVHVQESTGRFRILVLQPTPLALYGGAEGIVAEGKDRGFRDRLDAWRGAQFLEQGAMRLATSDLVVATQLRLDLRNRRRTDIEARIRGCPRGSATDEQTAQDEHCHRQRELRRDERA